MSASTTQSTTTSSTLARKGPEKSTTQYVWDGWQSDDDIGSLYSKGQARDHNIPHAPPCGARYEHLTIERDAPRESDDKFVGTKHTNINSKIASNAKLASTELESELDRMLEEASASATSMSIVSSLNTDMDSTHYSSFPRRQHQRGRELETDGGSVVSEISSKVQRMREELHVRVLEARQLGGELQRLQIARQRRASRAKERRQAQLNDARQEQADALHKVKDFCARLQQDVERLEKQQEALQRRLESTERDREQGLRKVQAEATKRLQRARRQWESDEKSSCEKALQKRADALQKQAADAFGPRLDTLVSEGKKRVAQRRDQGQAELERLRLALAAEREQQLATEKERLAEQRRDDIQRAEHQLERQQQARKHAWAAELDAVREQGKAELRRLEEATSRTSRVEQEQAQEALQALARRDSKQVQEMMAEQQKELAALSQLQAKRRTELQQRLQEQQQQGQSRTRHLREQLHKQRVERRVEALRGRVALEGEQLLLRLRDEAEKGRRETQAALDAETEELRLQSEQQYDAKQTTEQRNLSRMSTLRAEIEDYRAQLRDARCKIQTVGADVEETLNLKPTSPLSYTRDSGGAVRGLKAQLRGLRGRLREVEAEWSALQPQQDQELRRRRDEIEQERRQWRGRLEDARIAVGAHREQRAAHRKAAEGNCKAELSRISEKVAVLVGHKEATRRQLELALVEMRACSVELHGRLEDARDSKFGQ